MPSRTPAVAMPIPPRPDVGLPMVPPGLPGRRRAAATALLVLGLPALLGILLVRRASLSYATPVLLVLTLVVAVALVGGRWVALPGALAGGLALNWFFTPPYDTLVVDRADQLLVLGVYLAVAVAVSVVVDLAARRAAQALRARAEAEALSSLAGATLAAAQTLPDLLERARSTFGMRQVGLLERVGGGWVAAETVSSGRPAPDEVELQVPAGPDLLLSAWGPVLFAEDKRVMSSFAEAAGTAFEGWRLAEQAQSAARLEAADRMRTALLAAVGHDLRTPLAGIKAAVSSLRQSDVAFTGQEREELLETVETSADRLQALVANLLDASRLQAGALSVLPEAVGLDEVVGQVLLALSPADRDRVLLDVPEPVPSASADPGLLERVLANLLDNALRYTPFASRVSLEVGLQDDERVRCVVADHGSGVPAGQRESLFAPFQRLGDRTPGGVGLGLTVARGFTEAMAGTLTAAETPGGGLTMTVILPRAPDTLPLAPEAGPLAPDVMAQGAA